MKKILNNKYMLIPCILVIFASLLAFSFAEMTYAVNYTVGEHGVVNDKEGNFTENYLELQNDYPIVITPEEGYMVDKIIIDGEENTTYTTAAQSVLNYVIEDLDITQDTNIEVTFKEINNPDLVAMAEEGFNIKASGEGPGTVMTVFENNDGKYLPTDEEEDRTISWVADSDSNGIVKSVTINGVEDPSYAGKEDGSYVATTGDVDVKVVFEVSSTPISDTDEDEFAITTSAGAGGEITDGYEYSVDEDNTEHEIIYSADTGYVINTVKINGVEKTVADNVGIGEDEGIYTFKTGNQSIEVTFTNVAMSSTDAGKVSLTSDKTEVKRQENVTFEITFEPANTSVDSTFDIDISDFDFVSSDKGELKDTTVSGTIKAGTDKEVVKLTVKYGNATLDGLVKATLTNNGKSVSRESDLLLVSVEEDPPEDVILDHSELMKHPTYVDDNDKVIDEDEDTVEDTDSTKKTSKDSSNVKTGDETNYVIFYVLGILALAGLVIAIMLSRRSKKRLE